MEIRFDNQVVLITGASTGIGAALARAFGAAGARVVVHYNRSQTEAQTVAAEIEAAGGEALLIQADVTIPAQIQQLVAETMARFGRIDILINNAGGLLKREQVANVSDELYRRVMDLNFTSTFQLCQLVIPIMQQQGRGNIINLTSIAGRNGGAGGAVIYATSKGAVSTFTRGLAKELVGHNIRVNAIAPGVILTPFHERYTSLRQLQGAISTIPMGRAGQPEECVGAAFFLASEVMSSYITGQIIEVNGGQLMP
jgi:3-oxoacyl-[acyl-carrier protein] reductase